MRTKDFALASRLCVSLLAVAAALAAQRLEFAPVNRDVVEARLERLSHDVARRRANLVALFEEAGCAVRDQPIKGHKHPNVLCTLPAASDATIMVGAHFDLASLGKGAVDNWSGASMLPSLYQSLVKRPHRHTFVFAGFAGEEKGLTGSTFFVKQLAAGQKVAMRAYVNLECLGLGNPSIWLSRSDKKLASAYVGVARAMEIPPAAVNVDNVGDDDSHPFARAGVPVISIHSVTQENIRILHSVGDQLEAIDRESYYRTYVLLAAYLAYLDANLE